MPSPDFSEYIDLTEYDLQPQELYAQSIVYAKTALPEFNPRPGTLEDAILQGGAFLAASTMGALNRLPDELMEGILRVMGVLRSEPTQSTVAVEFGLFNDGDTVQENTVFSFDYFNGVETVQFPFVLQDPVTAAAGVDTVAATLKSLILGQIPSFEIGTQLISNSPSSVVLTCTTTGEVTQGQNSETEEDFFRRASTHLQSLSATLNTAKQVENYVLRQYSAVKRVKAYDLVEAVEFRTQSVAVGGATTTTSGSGSTATVTTSSAHGLSVGHVVTVAGVTPSGYNGTYSVSVVPSSTQIRYANATTGSQTVAGTVTYVGNGSHSGTTATVRTSTSFENETDDYPGTIYRVITPQFYGDTTYDDVFPSGTFSTAGDSLAINASTGTITYTDTVSDTDATGPLVDVVMLDSLLLSYVSGNQEPGNFVVFVCGENGEPLGRDVRNEIEDDLAERIPAGLKFKVLDAWTYDLSLTITIGVAPGFNSSAVADSVELTLENFVSPDNWRGFEDTVRIYEMAGAAAGVNGVSFVSTLVATIPSYPDSLKGNQLLVEQIVSGSQIIGFSALYAGLLPRLAVEVVVL